MKNWFNQTEKEVEQELKTDVQKGLSQEELGYKLNVTRQSVSLWENNQAQPSLENLIALAKIFNVSISELCGENEEIDKKSNDVVDEALFKASVNYTEQIYVNVYKSLYFKHLYFKF